jgi:hypothetical protein
MPTKPYRRFTMATALHHAPGHDLLKRYGEKALEESAARADELFAQQDHDGAAVWRRIIDAVGQLANTTPPRQLH